MTRLSKFSIATLMVAALFIAGCGGGNGASEAEVSEATEIQQTENAATVYEVNTSESIINWMGKKTLVPKQHTGTVKISKGILKANDGQLVGGAFVVDMTSIDNEDLDGSESEAKLVRHLKSADFFEVETYPTATLEIASVESSGGSARNITGNFTLKGVTKQITFPATVNVNGDVITASATFSIDRSKWNVRYGSDSFFDDLGDGVISDMIELDVNLKANASAI